MPGIFISYRREDSIGHTGRLYDLLAKHFGKANVFMDIDTIGPGEDFSEVIEKTCESCQVFLAIIGRSWTRVADHEGNRRLDNPSDFVRLEILHALEKKILVVPVLVDGARMPDAKSLPDDLKRFSFRNAWEINDMRFHHDVDQLIEALQKMQPTLQPVPSLPELERLGPAALGSKTGEQFDKQRTRVTQKTLYAGIGAAVVLAVVLVGVFNWPKSTPSPQPVPAELSRTYDVPSLQASVTAPLRFFMFAPGRRLPPPGQRPYATSFRSVSSSGKLIFWEVSFNFQGQFPPPDYQIESIWYRNSKEVFRGVGNYRGPDVSTRAYHNRYSWDPPGGQLSVGQYRVDLYIAGRRITSADFVVQP